MDSINKLDVPMQEIHNNEVLVLKCTTTSGAHERKSTLHKNPNFSIDPMLCSTQTRQLHVPWFVAHGCELVLHCEERGNL